MAKHNDIGKWGEQVAVDKLVAEGCAIVERNWTSGKYEIDIIAQNDGEIVFCEVKTRANNDSEDPYEAFDRKKMTRMLRAANHYIDSNEVDLEPRFDFFAVTGTQASFDVIHHRDIQMPVLKNIR